MKILKKVINNDYIFSLFQKFVNIISGIVIVSLINRYLGVSLKGKYEYIINITNILTIILGFGMNSSYSYMKRLQCSNQVQKYIDVFFTQSFLYFIVSIMLILVTKNYLVAITSILIISRIINSQLSGIGVVEFIKVRQLIQIITYFIEMLFTIFVYFFIPQNMEILIWLLIIKNLLSSIFYMFNIKCIPRIFHLDFSLLKRIWNINLFSMFTNLLSELNYSLDVIIMKILIPYSEIGLYSVGSKLAQYIWLIPDSFKEVLYSRTAKEDAIEEIQMILRINLFISILLILLILFFGKIIIYILYGVEYLDSYIVTLIVFLGIPSMVLYKLLSPLYNANGKQKKIFLVLLISVICNIFMNFLVIPMYGKIGAAMSTVVSYTICGLVLFVDFKNTYKLNLIDCLILKKSDIKKIAKFLKINK